MEYNGGHYRVWIKGRVGKVYSKAAIVRPTIETRTAMLGAMNELTGCQLSEPVWVNSHIEGVVECPTNGEPG